MESIHVQTCFKVTKQSRLWRRNQKVWLLYLSRTGGNAAFVTGRHRGKGRWINGWVHWNAKSMPTFIECNVSKQFREFLHKTKTF